MAGYWPSALFVDQHEVERNKNRRTKQSKTRPITSHFDRTSSREASIIVSDH